MQNLKCIQNKKLITINGEMTPYSENGYAKLVYYNVSELISALSFIGAKITIDFPTNTEKTIFNIQGAEPKYETWFTLTSTGNLSIPCRLDVNGNVVLCNYTGMNLQNRDFYGQLIYCKKRTV